MGSADLSYLGYSHLHASAFEHRAIAPALVWYLKCLTLWSCPLGSLTYFLNVKYMHSCIHGASYYKEQNRGPALLCSHTETEGVLIAGQQASRTPSPRDRSVSCSTPPEFRRIGTCGISGPPAHGQVGQWLLGDSGELIKLEIIDINKAFKNGISSPESEMLPSRK